MTKQVNFGRRSAEDRRQAWDEYRSEMAALGKQMPLGKWVLGGLGIFVAISVLVHSNNAGDVSTTSAAHTAPKAAVSSAPLVKVPEPCEATLKEYASLRPGMSLRRAASIIGCAGEEMSRVSIGGQETFIVSWSGNGGFISNMNATFDNDRLVAKAQLGLE